MYFDEQLFSRGLGVISRGGPDEEVGLFAGRLEQRILLLLVAGYAPFWDATSVYIPRIRMIRLASYPRVLPEIDLPIQLFTSQQRRLPRFI